MAVEGPSKCNNFSENTLNLDEQQMRKVFRKERDEILKQKVKTETFLIGIQGTIAVLDEEIKEISEAHAKLESQNKLLIEGCEADIQTKLNIENYVETMKTNNQIFGQQINQLKNTLQAIEGNTESIGESNTEIFKHITEYLIEQNRKEKAYAEQINKMNALTKETVINNNTKIEEKQLILTKYEEELAQLVKDEDELKSVLEEARNKNSQRKVEFEKLKLEKNENENKYTKLQEDFSKSMEAFHSNKQNWEEQIMQMNKEIDEIKKLVVNQQIMTENLEQENKTLNENIEQAQTDLSNLEKEQSDKKEYLIKLETKLEDIKTEITNEHKRNCEVMCMTDKVKYTTEQKKKYLNRNKELKQQLIDKKQLMVNLEQVRLQKIRQHEEIVKQIEDTKEKTEEISLKYENQFQELNKNIIDIQLRNKEKQETNEKIRDKIENNLDRKSELKYNIKSNEKKLSEILKNNGTELEKLKEELNSLKSEHQTANNELKNISKSKENEIKLIEKKCEGQISKVNKEIKQLRDKMDTIMKNNHDKHIKEKQSLEDNIKNMMGHIHELKSSREYLQQEINKNIEKSSELTTKIEAIKNAKLIKIEKATNLIKSSTELPQIPNKRSNPGFTTSTPEKIRKENKFISRIEKEQQTMSADDNFNKNVPLTKKTDNKKPKATSKQTKKITAPNIWPTDFETTDDSFSYSKTKITSSTSKPESKEIKISTQVPTKLISSDFGKNKYISLTQNTETKKADPLTSQIPKLSSSPIWPTDNEMTDDNFNISKNKNVPLNQKSKTENKNIDPNQKKKSVYDFKDDNNDKDDIFESLKTTNKKFEPEKLTISPTQTKKSLANFWDNDSSDDSFFGKLHKSEKIKSNFTATSKPVATINIESSTSEA